MLLADTGLRIGQALALRHGDMKIWNNEIHVIYRKYNENEVSNKTRRPNVIHVSMELMSVYNQYLLTLKAEPSDQNFVFVCLKDQDAPLTYTTARKIFLSISFQVNFRITPHMFRHTHATQLLREGWDAALVQKRLGHSSVSLACINVILLGAKATTSKIALSGEETFKLVSST